MIYDLFEAWLLVGLMMLLLLGFYLANTIVSLFYNIKQIGENFEKQRLKDGGLKVLVIVISTLIFVACITLFMQFIKSTGYLPDIIPDTVSVAVIIGIFGKQAMYYATQFVITLMDIMKKGNENEQTTINQ